MATLAPAVKPAVPRVSSFKPPAPAAAKPLTPPPEVTEPAVSGPVDSDPLAAALSAADDLLAGLSGGLDVVEEEEEAAVEEPAADEPAAEPAAEEEDCAAVASPPPAPVVEAPAAPLKKAPVLAPVRKPFAAPAVTASKPAAPAAAAAGTGGAAEGKVSRSPSAFTLFCQSRRAVLKAEKPELSFGELAKALGAEWAALGADVKAPFFAQAEARKASDAAANGGGAKPAVAAKKRPAPTGDKPAVAKKAKPAAGAQFTAGADGAEAVAKVHSYSAWDAFCKLRRASLKAERPELAFGELAKALGEEWKATSPEEREQYKEHAAEMSAEAALRPPKPAKAPKVPKLKGQAARAAAEDAAAVAEDEAAMETDGAQAASASTADGYDWGEDRSLPVQFLLSRLNAGSFIAFREAGAIPTAECPVAARPADGAAPSAEQLLHTEEQENDLKISMAQFKAALQERTDAKGIDLEDLGAASPLCSMLLLEALRFKGGPLHKEAVKGKKNVLLGVSDALIQVPAVGLSFVVERLVRGAVQVAVAAERRRHAAAAAPGVHAKAMSAEPLPAMAMEE